MAENEAHNAGLGPPGVTAYGKKCRCAGCRAANAAAVRDRRARRKSGDTSDQRVANGRHREAVAPAVPLEHADEDVVVDDDEVQPDAVDVEAVEVVVDHPDDEAIEQLNSQPDLVAELVDAGEPVRPEVQVAADVDDQADDGPTRPEPQPLADIHIDVPAPVVPFTFRPQPAPSAPASRLSFAPDDRELVIRHYRVLSGPGGQLPAHALIPARVGPAVGLTKEAAQAVIAALFNETLLTNDLRGLIFRGAR